MQQNPQPTERRVTQDDVASMAGVTRSVVSYVLNGGRAVAPETRERVLAAIERLGYRPNKYAQGLMRGGGGPAAVRQIGIVLNNARSFQRPYYAEILAGIHAKAHDESYHIRFIRFFNDLRNPALFNGLIHDEEVCGLILIALDQSISTDQDRALLERAHRRIPNIVCVEWQSPGLSSVTFNRQEAALTAARHLLSLGHRRLAYIGERDNRVAGFHQALIESGVGDVSSYPVEDADDMRSGYQAAERVLPGRPDISAVVAGSDEVAIGVLRWLHAHGITVPGQVALASIDGIEMSEFTDPPLTTVDVQKANMGRLAVQMLIDRDRRGESQPVTVLLPSTLVVRESCGAPRS